MVTIIANESHDSLAVVVIDVNMVALVAALIAHMDDGCKIKCFCHRSLGHDAVASSAAAVFDWSSLPLLYMTNKTNDLSAHGLSLSIDLSFHLFFEPATFPSPQKHGSFSSSHETINKTGHVSINDAHHDDQSAAEMEQDPSFAVVHLILQKDLDDFNDLSQVSRLSDDFPGMNWTWMKPLCCISPAWKVLPLMPAMLIMQS